MVKQAHWVVNGMLSVKGDLHITKMNKQIGFEDAVRIVAVSDSSG